MNKEKLNIEMDKSDFSKWDYLSKQDLQLISTLKKRLGSINNLFGIITILLLCMSLIYEFKYSEYIFFLISILVITTTIYVIIRRIKIKSQIKLILFPTLKNSDISNRLKIKIYYNKFLDRADTFVIILYLVWAISNLIWSVAKILGRI